MELSFTDSDPALRPLLDRYLDAADRDRIEPLIDTLGRRAAGELDDWAADAEANPPTLRQYSPTGDRIDEVEFHPAYDRLVKAGFCDFGLAALSNRGTLGWSGPAPHIVKYALSYLFSQAEYGLGCPINMTDSAARVLQLFDPHTFADEIAALTSTDPDNHATGAMFMTEIDGGTDLAQTATVATDNGDHWLLNGRKWFCSNVTADIILTLAQVPGQGHGTRGLGMFLVPRTRPDGSRNSYRVDRLKNKLGTRSMASGEVTLVDTYALPVGQLSRGIQQMLEMVNHSRVSNIMRSTALMRRATFEAIEHARQRVIFGRKLADQPLMRRTLLDLVTDTEAALGLVFELGDQLTAGDLGNDDSRIIARVMTPAGKYAVCKRGRSVTGEAMEVRGGNGYIEDFVNPRLVRDAHLGSIWEGASNVVALDVLRCMRRHNAHAVVADVYSGRVASLDLPSASRSLQLVSAQWAELRERGNQLLDCGTDTQEALIGDYTQALTEAVMASVLLEQAAWERKTGRGRRKELVATAYTLRLYSPHTLPVEALDELAAIIDGDNIETSDQLTAGATQ
ncbi:acyl-CoA dehydrogenase family protein [Rhodococcus wratislaviensis]|uniref:Putative acyl-CoA dehydrogenase n=1 Tax=Rhodococcus wratislaviensis NBRC 100605 TaxID=1219028 RepID=X0PXN4_RHOWR|nr:acyl-CoA dehydrogenase family protein [Rhodococcus wratislaviensis]GAF48158.1 putative acyl-CoA dehydrogenase [Rhodococcus wratislaviensis NBRC 100605]